MQRMDLQKQATMLIEQLSTEKLKEAVNHLAELQDNDANNTLPMEFTDEIPETGLGTRIYTIFLNRLVVWTLRFFQGIQCGDPRFDA